MTVPVNSEQPRRPARWSLRNWPVRLKVFAIVLIPLVLALAFGGAQINSAVHEERDMRLAADRATVIPPLVAYISALQDAINAYSGGADTQPAVAGYDKSKTALENRLKDASADTDVNADISNLLDGGQNLLDGISANTIALRDRVTAYAPILLTAEDAIAGSVRGDTKLRTEAEGLSSAVGVRGQMFMQQLLVDQGGVIPDPELRQSLVTVAGTEPSALVGLNQLIGAGSTEARTLQAEMTRRMGILSNPDEVIAGNPVLRESIQTTGTIADGVIKSTSTELPSAVERHADEKQSVVVRDSVIVAAGLLIALLTTWLVSRSLIKPLRTLRDSALHVAHTDLEKGISRVRAGDEREPEPLPIYTTEEVGQVAHAVDELHTQALLLAGEEARLRVVVNDMFETMSRRNRSLIDQQLSLIDSLERNEQDPTRLESLFRLDHLATRMRRISANLLVLAGAPVSRESRESVSLVSAINAAVSEVKDYQRVEIEALPDSELVGRVAGDAIHMMAELIDNALRYSPPVAQVRVTVSHTTNAGLLIEIHDDGIGMTDADLRIANMRLHGSGDVTPDNTRHMGLFVVSRLAHMHKLVVRLRHSSPDEPSSGTTAELYLPAEVLEHLSPIDSDQTSNNAEWDVDVSQTAPEEQISSPWFGDTSPASPETRDTDEPQRPTSTASFFAARGQAQEAIEDQGDETDLIYRKMMAELALDPQDLAVPQDWQSVWDSGWETAAEAEQAAVAERTEHGLPVREPGARLVPGAATPAASNRNGVPSNRDRSGPKKPKPKNEQDPK